PASLTRAISRGCSSAISARPPELTASRSATAESPAPPVYSRPPMQPLMPYQALACVQDAPVTSVQNGGRHPVRGGAISGKEHLMPHVFRFATRQLVPLAVAALLVVASTPAQVVIGIPKDEKPLPIDAAGRAKVIKALLKELEESYVFPDVAKKMRSAVEARMEGKEYDAVETGQELAKKLTAHLQEVSKDKHLRVMCHTQKRVAPPKGEKPKGKEL